MTSGGPFRPKTFYDSMTRVRSWRPFPTHEQREGSFEHVSSRIWGNNRAARRQALRTPDSRHCRVVDKKPVRVG